MSIPEVYTRESFSDYLQYEVLMEAALELGWIDILPLFDPTMPLDDGSLVGQGKVILKDLGTLGNSAVIVPSYFNIPTGTKMTMSYLIHATATITTGATSLPVTALPVAVPAGTLLSFTIMNDIGFGPFPEVRSFFTTVDKTAGATSLTIDALKQDHVTVGSIALYDKDVQTVGAPVKAGDELIKFSTTFTVDSANGIIGNFYNAPPSAGSQIRHIRYGAIIDETLLKLGVEDISTVDTPNEITKLRLFGRRECWNFAMQTLSADYSYSTLAGVTSRYDVYMAAKKNFVFEDIRLREMYPDSQLVSTSGVFALSGASKINVRW